MSNIFNFFPLTIYKSKIGLNEEERQILIGEIYNLEKNSDKNKSINKAWTGDTQGHEFLHENEKFKNLFAIIEIHIKRYLEKLNIDSKLLDIYYSRAWATISRNVENISPHKHIQSHLSFAYYLNLKKTDSKLVFFDENRHNEFLPGLFTSKSVNKKNVIVKRDLTNTSTILFEASEDEIVIFPSKTLHGTQSNTNNNDRISISADIIIHAKDSSGLEHLVPPINKWKKFED